MRKMGGMTGSNDLRATKAGRRATKIPVMKRKRMAGRMLNRMSKSRAVRESSPGCPDRVMYI